MSLNLKTADGYQPLASLGGNVINGAEMQHYSTEERMIGYWTNGKPLYRKCFECNLALAKGWNTIASVSSLNIDEIVKVNGSGTYGLIDKSVYPFIYNSSTLYNGFLLRDGNLIIYDTNSSTTAADKNYLNKVVIEYTKTTDSPISNNNTYSTDEILTGKTWIDGKPIYRKVFTGVDAHLTYNTWCDTNKYLYNVDTLIDGMFIDSDTHYLQSYMGFNLNLDRIRVLNSRNTTLDFTGATIILEYTKTN